ncbi:MAG: hypothetical protein KDA78_12385 [Planctomycetaceae bacterium]|nr:hypothetical protein [Planctomycetaceae bacterium]
MRILPTIFLISATLIPALQVSAQPPLPQSPYYHPLDQTTPPGMAGIWAGALGRADCHYFQPVQFRLPRGGDVSVLDPVSRTMQPLPPGAQAGLLVGPVYRIRIANLPDYPGVELYPTLELIDRLHPPAALRTQFPVPVELSEDEIRDAVEDRLVTKIIYLEQPDLALPEAEKDRIREESIPQNRNLMTEADLRGRPILIFRVGGRIPSPQEMADPRMPPPAPLEIIPVPVNPAQARLP